MTVKALERVKRMHEHQEEYCRKIVRPDDAIVIEWVSADGSVSRVRIDRDGTVKGADGEVGDGH